MPETTASPGILTRLRHDTRPYHDALEQNAFNQQLGAGTVSADLTRWFLRKLYGFVAPFEQQLRRHAADFGPEWEIGQRLRTPLLLQDLAPETAATLPVAPQLPPLDTRPRLLGALYVLEGSTLGGQVITRQLAQSGIPLRTYFSGAGELTGLRWKRFTTLLTAEAETMLPEEQAALVESARLTFQYLSEWINRA